MQIERTVVFLISVGLASAATPEGMAAGSEEVAFEIHGQPVSGTPIAIPPFISIEGASSVRAREISSIVNLDVSFSGDFFVFEDMRYPASFTHMPENPLQIQFGSWASLGARYLVHGLYLEDRDKFSVRWRLFDTRGRRQIMGYEYRGARDMARSVAHRIADDIVQTLTGKNGISRTRMAFVCKTGAFKEIWVSDWDGHNPKQLTTHRSITACPEWSPDGKSIAYTSYGDNNPDLYTVQITGGAPRRISRFQGLNIAPTWAPQLGRIALTLSKDGNTEIYLTDFLSGMFKRITRHRALDSSPTFSPDGTQIAFVSTRSGSPQIWATNLDGTSLRRLSYQGGQSYDPAWSPQGDRIAYVVETAGQGLEIYVMDANGRNATRLTDSPGTNEGPSWSPDGRHLAFCSNRTGRHEVFIMKDDGWGQRQITQLPGPCNSPDWSPYFVAQQ